MKKKIKIKYVLHIGWSYDYVDNRAKFMNAKQLANRFGLDMRECIVIDKRTPGTWERRAAKFLESLIQIKPPIIKKKIIKKEKDLDLNGMRMAAGLTMKETAARANLTIDQYKFLELGRTRQKEERINRVLKVFRAEIEKQLCSYREQSKTE